METDVKKIQSEITKLQIKNQGLHKEILKNKVKNNCQQKYIDALFVIIILKLVIAFGLIAMMAGLIKGKITL